MLKVYLAGPGIFYKDAVDTYEGYKRACLEAGFQPLSPLDHQPVDNKGHLDPTLIFVNDRDQMDSCDLVIADISPFRGVSMDPGTAFEIGYIVAQGKPVFAWSTAAETTLWNRVSLLPSDGTVCEDFGLTENLMITIPAGIVYPSFVGALTAAAQSLCAPCHMCGFPTQKYSGPCDGCRLGNNGSQT